MLTDHYKGSEKYIRATNIRQVLNAVGTKNLT
jgi:hypothetical protein